MGHVFTSSYSSSHTQGWNLVVAMLQLRLYFWWFFLIFFCNYLAGFSLALERWSMHWELEQGKWRRGTSQSYGSRYVGFNFIDVCWVGARYIGWMHEWSRCIESSTTWFFPLFGCVYVDHGFPLYFDVFLYTFLFVGLI
jgi:hypothetical protein